MPRSRQVNFGGSLPTSAEREIVLNAPSPKTESQGQQSAWTIYGRLLGYTLHYKFRMAILVFFSVMVAASFTSMIFSAGSGLQIVFDTQDSVDARTERVMENLRGFSSQMEDRIGWAPANLDERYRMLVERMRQDRRYALASIAAVLLILAFISAVARYLQEYNAGVIGANVTTRLNLDMYQNIVSLPHPFFEERSMGDVVARFTSDSFVVNRGLVSVFVKLFREPIKAIFLVGLALSVDVFLTLVVLGVVSPIVFVIVGVGKRVRHSVRGQLTKIANLASLVSETITGITVIKSFRMERYQSTRVGVESRRLRKYLKRIARADAAISPATQFLMMVGVAVFIMFSEQRVSSNALTSGELIILFGALAALLDPLRKLASVNNMVQGSVASAERVFEFIDMKSSIQDRPNAVRLGPLDRAVRFEDVHFSYDGQIEVLHGIDLEIGHGEMVALVGLSGSGKSTIAKLLPRFYDPTEGRITFDGVDLRDATLESLRDQIAVVTQETILFRETVRTNIAYGREDLSDAEVREAARKAHADSFIEALPQGYDTLLGEAGGNLSAGQRQRIAIARAIIKDPAVLILDEATSNLDSESEHAIQEAISEFVVGRATLVIAHRLSTIERADRIVVIDEGRIVEEGTYDALLAQRGIFERLHRLQFAHTKRETGS